MAHRKLLELAVWNIITHWPSPESARVSNFETLYHMAKGGREKGSNCTVHRAVAQGSTGESKLIVCGTQAERPTGGNI